MPKQKTDFDVVNNATEMQVTLSTGGYLYVREGARGGRSFSAVVILTARQLRKLARTADRMAEVRERCETAAEVRHAARRVLADDRQMARARAQDVALLG